MNALRSQAVVSRISSYLPETIVDNHELAQLAAHWTPEKIFEKTGIRERHVAGEGECASDLAYNAALRLIMQDESLKSSIDYLIFCTQSPDYPLPTTACLLQDRLGLSTTCGALDFNQGCSGYIYGLGLANGLIESGQAKHVLLLTGDTYCRFLNPEDVGVRTLFGDAGTATLISVREQSNRSIGPFLYGTDGSGGDNLCLKRSGNRCQPAEEDPGWYLIMDGPEIFTFALEAVPASVNGLLSKASKSLNEIDLFVFHQANRYMLEHLRHKLRIPEDRFVIEMETTGNTVSSSIPLALESAEAKGQLRPGMLVMLIGFGVGYSWGGTLVQW